MDDDLDYETQLAMARQQEQAFKKARKKAKKQAQQVPFPWLEFGIAAVNDISDWLVIGSIPILGDVVDGLTTAGIWFSRIMHGGLSVSLLPMSGATIIEIIPGGDLLPSYMLAVIIYWLIEKSAAKAGLGGISKKILGKLKK